MADSEVEWVTPACFDTVEIRDKGHRIENGWCYPISESITRGPNGLIKKREEIKGIGFRYGNDDFTQEDLSLLERGIYQSAESYKRSQKKWWEFWK